MVDPGLSKIVGMEPDSGGRENHATLGSGVGVHMTASTAEKAILCMADPRSGQFRHGAAAWDA